MRSRWDLRIAYLTARGRWWWGAWRADPETDLFGFAASRAEAGQAMYRAVADRDAPAARTAPGGQAAGGGATADP
ncbi:MAG: hypothetical protein AB7I38_11600 [Dehalococcoidia bacterium]